MPSISKTLLKYDPYTCGIFEFEGNSSNSLGFGTATDTSMSYGVTYGYFNKGANFSGTARISYDNPFLLNGAKSISFWMNSSSTATNNSIIQNCYWDASSNGFSFYAVQGGNMIFLVRSGATTASATYAKTNFFDGKWHHVVGTHTGDATTNGLILYLDGVSVGQATGLVDPFPTYSLHIGSSRDTSNANNFTGQLDDILLIQRVLTPYEIKSLFKKQFLKDRPHNNRWDLSPLSLG